MEKDHSFSAAALMPGNFSVGDHYSLDLHHQQFMKPHTGESSCDNNNNQMVDYMLNNDTPQQQQMSSGFCNSSTSLDKLSFADVMQFADFGPKLALNQSKTCEEESGIDPVYFLKFPVLNEKLQDDHAEQSDLMVHQENDIEEEGYKGMMSMEESIKGRMILEGGGEREDTNELARVNSEGMLAHQIQFLGDQDAQKSPVAEGNNKNKRKRPRTTKTSEEVESQRMTHIAVERNRRKQMNEHLRVLRSLMPGSYVQRGDQASIIGGAIEFVRELEQLLQCLESQKRRRIYGDAPRPMGDHSSSNAMQQAQAPFIVPDDPAKLVEFGTGLREEIAESKSCLADVEVRVLGFDAMIKILCRRRPGQLIKTIAALEDLELNILHTNVTTIEQTVLYSFNVKVSSESRFTPEDIANSVQQIFSYIHANM